MSVDKIEIENILNEKVQRKELNSRGVFLLRTAMRNKLLNENFKTN